MQDLNDLFYFSIVVEKNGFAAAGRALDIPKSRLSRRIAQLEERLGVRLLQRSTRRFAVTDAGQRFYRHCQAVMADITTEADIQQLVERFYTALHADSVVGHFFADLDLPHHLPRIRQHTGHSSDTMLARYIRESELFTGNAV